MVRNTVSQLLNTAIIEKLRKPIIKCTLLKTKVMNTQITSLLNCFTTFYFYPSLGLIYVHRMIYVPDCHTSPALPSRDFGDSKLATVEVLVPQKLANATTWGFIRCLVEEVMGNRQVKPETVISVVVTL